MAFPTLQQVDVLARVIGIVVTVVSVIVIPLYTKSLHGLKASVERIADLSSAKVRAELDKHAREDAEHFGKVEEDNRQLLARVDGLAEQQAQHHRDNSGILGRINTQIAELRGAVNTSIALATRNASDGRPPVAGGG